MEIGCHLPATMPSAVLRSNLDKFLLAYDAHANDDSNNFRDVQKGNRRYPRPWMVANTLAEVFHHADPIDVNDDAWDEVFKSEELRRTLKSVEDVEAGIRDCGSSYGSWVSAPVHLSG